MLLGELEVSLATVCSVLAAGDLLLLDWVVEQCGAFLLGNLHLENIVLAGRLANMYRVENLRQGVDRFYQAEFRNIVMSEELGSLSREEMITLLGSDGIVAEEDFICDSLVKWCEVVGMPSGVEELVELIRFPLCSKAYTARLATETRYSVIQTSPAYQRFKCGGVVGNHLQRDVRCRGSNDILVIHHDASEHLYGYDQGKEAWRAVADIPFGGGYEYAAIASQADKLYLVGGRSKDGRSLRAVFCLDFQSMQWSRLSDMKEVRWYHGAVLVGSRLYAVAGCGQLDSVEYLELDSSKEVVDSWQLVQAMNIPRHMPGIGTLHSTVFVCGGTDDSWSAFATVEALDTETGEWRRLPDMQVPR